MFARYMRVKKEMFYKQAYLDSGTGQREESLSPVIPKQAPISTAPNHCISTLLQKKNNTKYHLPFSVTIYGDNSQCFMQK